MLGCLLLLVAGAPGEGTEPLRDERPGRPVLTGEDTGAPLGPSAGQLTRRSPAVPGLGPKLARRIREAGPHAAQRFAARGLSRAQIEAAGGRVTADLGPIIAGELPGAALRALAPRATYVDAPHNLRLALDVSRPEIRADMTDQASELEQRYRGAGVLIGFFDTGVDLAHPDLRTLEGVSRVQALWDQATPGVPPSGQTVGAACDRASLEAGRCGARDTNGHGTHVAAIALGNGPLYRGVAPAAELLVVRSEDFELFFEALAFLSQTAATLGKPLVLNLSLGGHEGAHDGSSLEAQAIDAYPHLVVAAAGNEGRLPVHAGVALAEGTAADVVLRFPALSGPMTALLEIWGEAGESVEAQLVVVGMDGSALIESGRITTGGQGTTETLSLDGSPIGQVELDAEATPNPFNQRPHLRLEVRLSRWQDPPSGPGWVTVRLAGSGRAELWVDTPASQPAPMSFAAERVLPGSAQVLGDSELSLSDLASAVSAVAVSAYTTRNSIPTPTGQLNVNGSLGSIAAFSSHGPTLDPGRTGPKPDLAAPGNVVVAARSKDSPATDPGIVSPLYRGAAGTSMATPHAAAVAALVLEAKPGLNKSDVKQILLASARPAEGSEQADLRFGAGRLDAEAAVERALGYSAGCGCTGAAAGPAWLLVLLLIPPLLRRSA